MDRYKEPTLLKVAGSAAIILGVVFTAAVAADSTNTAIDQYMGYNRNERCEDQLPPLLRQLDLPFNGSARYNPGNGNAATYIPSMAK